MRPNFLKGEPGMKGVSCLQQCLQAFFITGNSIFVLMPALAEDPVRVAAATASVPLETGQLGLILTKLEKT